MEKTSHTDPISWVSEQIKNLNKLVKIFYENSTSEITSDDYAKIRASLHTAIITIDEILPESDISTSGCNSIFAPYSLEDEKVSFESYFNKNLNPDLSHAGFLEELGKLIEITRNRKVIVTTNGSEIEMDQAKVLEDYLSIIPPF